MIFLQTHISETNHNLQNNNFQYTSEGSFSGHKTSIIHDARKEHPSSDIVVIGNVFSHGACQLTSGFGDVAHAARTAKVLRKEFPDKSLKLLVEGTYDESCKQNNNYQIFQAITSIPGVETILINHHKDSLKKDHANEMARKCLLAAEVIIHGPAETISIIHDNPAEFSGKIIYFDEYNTTSLCIYDKMPGIEYLKTGFPNGTESSGMFLKPPPMNQIAFENKLLRDHIKLSTQTCGLETYDSKESLYFCYPNNVNSLQSSIILFNILEGRSDKDITIISNCSKKDIQILEEDMHNIWKDISSIPDNPVKKIRLISRLEMEREWINNCSPDEGTGRTITILAPHGFSPNDAFLLGKYAKCSVSTGDLSMSDVLAAGRIPITDVFGKINNAYAMIKHLNSFRKKYPKYEKQVKCTENLMSAMTNIAHREYSISDFICRFKLFGTPKWYSFEQYYIDYLRSQPGAFLEDNLCNAVRIRLKTKKEMVQKQIINPDEEAQISGNQQIKKTKEERCCNMKDSVISFELSSFRKDDFTINMHLNKILGVNWISSFFNSLILFFVGRTVSLSKEQVNLIIKDSYLLTRLEKKGIKKRLIEVVSGENVDARMRPSPSKEMVKKQIMNPDEEAQTGGNQQVKYKKIKVL